MSLRETILSADDLGRKAVTIPEWGVTVEVRGLTASARAKLFEMGKNISELDARWHLISSSVYDPEKGERVFKSDDKVAVMEKNADVIDVLLAAINEINGYNQSAVEDAEKNSSADTQSDSSIIS
jgi:hypothetical protein